VFEESEGPIDFIANRDTPFVLGLEIFDPHDLVTGYYSVHQPERARSPARPKSGASRHCSLHPLRRPAPSARN
jgi:hypothetical protein